MSPGRCRFVVRLAASLGVAAVFVWALRREGIDVLPPRAAFARLAGWAVPVYVVLLAAVHLLRAVRWRHLLAPIAAVPVRRVVAVSWVGFCAIMLLPLRLGEVVRPVLVADERISKSAAFGTIALERVLDGVVVSAVLGACLLATPGSPAWIRATGLMTLGIFVAALAFLYALLAGRSLARRTTERVAGVFSERAGRRIGGWVDQLATGLGALPRRRALVPFLVETCAYWGVNGVSMWALARGVGLDLSVLAAFTAMGVLAVGILLPTGPGLFGNFQYSVFLALGLYLDEATVRGPGAAYIFLLWAIQLGFHLAAGAFGLWGGHLDVRGALRD